MAAIYVDDLLWRLLAASAGEDASLIVLFLMAVGCPLSYHKLDLGDEVLWIGVLVNFRLSTWALPDGKFERMLAYLRMMSEADETRSRAQVEAGQGLMIWITQTFPQMRSYLCIFYDVLARSRATNVSLTREQLHLLVNSLSEDMIIHVQIPGVQRTSGAKLSQLRNEQMLNVSGAQRFRPSKVRTFGRVLDPRSKHVSMTDGARQVAKLG